ncbi:MAG TPA: hypothetical protein VEB22_14975 [Phycisphaerales bacterium]|nr:hypothetical protein [Phycisphaerales bacterium]
MITEMIVSFTDSFGCAGGDGGVRPGDGGEGGAEGGGVKGLEAADEAPAASSGIGKG